MKNLLCIAATVALCACGREDVPATLTTKMDTWGVAFNAHDVDALAALYSDDAQYIYAFEGQEGQGLASLKTFYAGLFGATPDFTVERKSYEVIEISDGIAFGSGEYDDTFTGPMGKMTVPTHASEIFVKKNGVWTVRVDHASFVPPSM